MTPVEIFERLGFSPIFQGIAGILWMCVVLFIMVRAEQAKRHMDTSRTPAVPPNGNIARLADGQLQLTTDLNELRQLAQKIETRLAEMTAKDKRDEQ